ncbi:MAG: T9SS C-terminal target domain-containing protein [Ignavibacteriales bacterium]|nr:MAG: T9SS C-terminal target domain-containing protein [Ignavibacteriales bacterium]
MRKGLILALVFSVLNIIYAQDLTGIKICLNPGHGGYDSNDRYISATGFWESEGNLTKGLYLRDILQSHGATIIMSRTKNTTADDLPLSQIVAIANSNNVDYMHSIHSNAYDAKSNYTLILYQGTTATPTYPGSATMANYMVDQIYNTDRTTKKIIAGDFDFYGTGQPYLGVFKGLTMPHTLSEGSFHDYIPESFRLCNEVYLHNEAWAIARSFLSYWGKEPFSTGIIAGLVRDKSLKVDYYYISSARTGSESLKPLNNIKVTLQPGNKIYNGDEHNNGFFMFDSLQPGTYTVYTEAQNYYRDSVTVTVVANKVVFADKYLQYDTTSAPVILSTTPLDKTTNFKTIDPVIIQFNKSMNPASFTSAFSLQPAVEGSMSWGDDNRKLVFQPGTPLETNKTYTVTITKDALSEWNVPVGVDYSFSFTTNDRNKCSVVGTYPEAGEQDISTSVQFQIIVDAAVSTSLSSFELLDGLNNELTLKNLKATTANGLGYIVIEPSALLAENSNYSLLVLPSLKDASGYPLGDTVKINFRTISESYISGSIVDSFEVLGSWNDAKKGAGSTGIDTVASTFKLTYSKYYRGKYSARLAYTFKNNSDGICQYYNSGKFNLGTNQSEFGIWIYGDLSKNILEYWFTYDGSNESRILVDTINWSGWKLKRIKLSEIPGTGEKLFHSIVIRQAVDGLKSSVVYADDAQYNIVVPVKNDVTGRNLNYSLHQNYPNPFNPSTVISYSLMEKGHVSLKVYDTIGEEVMSLVNEEKSAGNYDVTFDARNLTSGIYLYKLECNGIVLSRKMILIK